MALNCKEVARSVSCDRLTGAGWVYRLRVELHLFLCRECRRYKKQMEAIGSAARELWNPEKEDAATLDRLQEQILKGFPPSTNEDTDDGDER